LAAVSFSATAFAQTYTLRIATYNIEADIGVTNVQPTFTNSVNLHAFTTDTNILAQETDNCEFIQYRDDLQTMTTNVFSGTVGGLKYIAGTYHTFGNNGSIAYQASVNNATNIALKNLVTNGPAFITAAQLYVDLTGAADHLPVVADYIIPIPAPLISSVSLDGTNLVAFCSQNYFCKKVSDSEPFSVRMTEPTPTLCRANQPSLVSKTN
jgi:hypothetical protein